MGDNVETFKGVVYPWHCDHQGHMTVMHYVGMFDQASWHMVSTVGFTQQRLTTEGSGWVDLKHTIEYLTEQKVGSCICVESTLRKLGNTTMTIKHRMYNSDTGKLAATSEIVMLYFDLNQRAKRPLSGDDKQRLGKFVEAQDE